MIKSEKSTLAKTLRFQGRLRMVGLAFLAERSPRYFSVSAIASRIQISQMVDDPVNDDVMEASLRELAETNALVDVHIDPVSKEPFWYATDQGIRLWVLSGRVHIE